MNWYRPLEQPLERPIRLGVLISGGGTTLLNFLRRIEAGELAAEVAVVVSNQPDCRGVARARDAGLQTVVIERLDSDGVADFSQRIFQQCDDCDVDLVVLAGFLALIEIPDRYAHRVMNIHPSLIPAFCGRGFYGHHVHEAVVARGVTVSGCTVHFADNEYDHGPIIIQRTVAVDPEMDAEGVAEAVFQEECQAYPQAISWYAEGRLSIAGNRVRVDPERPIDA